MLRAFLQQQLLWWAGFSAAATLDREKLPMEALLNGVDRLQAALDFEGWEAYPQYRTAQGLGRTGLAAFGLGLVFGVHLCWLVALVCVLRVRSWWTQLQWVLYVMSLSGFHFLEFMTTSLFKPGSVSYDSFVINHGKPYSVAAISSWVEFAVEGVLFPNVKGRPGLVVVGCALMFTGQVFRVLAMWTAGSNFNHQIMTRREHGHELVTHGVYRVLRHPSYFGWFWWCVGTQLTLGNPVCVLAYALAAWDFFRKRIPYEEATLVEFYPDDYPDYMRRTWIGIPFVPNEPITRVGTGSRNLDD